MTLNIQNLQQKIHASGKQKPADLVIRNARVLDVFNLGWFEGDVAIQDGKIVGIGEYEALQTIDAENRYLCPSFIDGHVHIESSMVPPTEFSKIVLPHGVTTVITDPHEIANVSGREGIQFMMDEAKKTELDIYFMLPSCVPSTPLENAGAVLKASDLEPFYNEDNVIGLAEVMNYPGLRDGDEDLLTKIVHAERHHKKIDGHLAGLPEDAINIYRTAGIHSDHECNTAEEAKQRLMRGMYVLMREGSSAKNLESLLPVVTPHNARRCLFCTDDKHLDELVEEGSIDHHIRVAVQSGIPVETAYQMASLNAAECYGLHEKGAIAPGYDADFLLIDDLEQVKISEVYKNGEAVVKNGNYLKDSIEKKAPNPELTSSVQLKEVTEESLQIPISSEKEAHVIEVIPNRLTTNSLVEEVNVKNGKFQPSTEKDQLKLIAAERHHNTGNVGCGIVKGFGMKEGAMATTVAHDSHNIVAVGTNDQDILTAIESLKKMQGGMVVVNKGNVLAEVPLPIAGLMSEDSFENVHQQLHQLHEGIQALQFTGNFHPFLTLSFLTLPVIPSLKLTDTGLFHVDTFSHIDVSYSK
ncbi:adenine deaminase [Halobacillus litoralis]|uniref:adenine deaminase n=1 Tax=Halobacillus litoralis TaxID=45668 RepID=UPI001CD695C0|nr:adenine deaminase [Halobacillus litoralis]MCA0969792.1 adenine deaminase [Halobacillus litoralis]